MNPLKRSLSRSAALFALTVIGALLFSACNAAGITLPTTANPQEPAVLPTAAGQVSPIATGQVVIVPSTSTPTPEGDILMCTPPACAPDEIYYCDGDCPGGCGTICVTPTPFDEGNIIMCTPPACGPDEVYYCEGDCPGGCGTTCATPTPAADGPAGGNAGGGAPAVSPVDWDALAVWLTEQWMQNANPAAVRAALQATGVQRDVNDWAAADFDGDLRDEWVVVLVNPSVPASISNTMAGNLWIVNGNGVVYEAYEEMGEDPFESGAPEIIGLADMTGDELPELVTNVQVCGAHTCYGNYRIVGFAGDVFADLVSHEPVGEGDPGNTIVLSYPDTRLVDIDQDGRTDFLVNGGTIGSVGAGIVRPRTEIWSWDGTAITLADTQLDPTEYRHHVLYEANDLMAAGEYDQALLLYEAAINDGALRTHAFSTGEAETYTAISQFAAFRLILLDIIGEEYERAAARLAWLEETYPGSAATQGAAIVVNSLADWPGLEAVCAQVEAELAARENPTGALADMGYGNPSLTAEDFCP